jgi:hypothetical protein
MPDPVSVTYIAGKLADTVISYIVGKGADAALAKPRAWWEEKKRTEAFRAAIARALTHFATRHSELSFSFFDETFLEHGASIEVRKFLTLSERPDPGALGTSYARYFTKEIPELLPACQDFLEFLDKELAADTELKDLVSDRLIRQIASEVWPAAGSADTEFGVLMEPEVGHGATEIYAGVQA